MPVAMLRLDANNDNNGNPRRIYVAIGPNGAIEGAWDEGYSGRQAVPEKYRSHAYNAVHINITPAEYRTWRKIADKQFGAKPKAAKRAAKPKGNMHKGFSGTPAASIFDEVLHGKRRKLAVSIFDVAAKKKRVRRHVHPDLDRARMLIDACRALPEVNTNTSIIRRAIESDAEAERLHDRYHRMALQARQEAEHAWSWLQDAYSTKERAAALKEAKRLAKERHK